MYQETSASFVFFFMKGNQVFQTLFIELINLNCAIDGTNEPERGKESNCSSHQEERQCNEAHVRKVDD